MHISPYPGSGIVLTATVTPGANWGWASVNIYRMWNYDSMFIWCTEMDADVSAGYDGTTPNDAYALDANGNVTGLNAIRIYIRAYMIGQTVGDVPVSGTVNNIPIPNTSSLYKQAAGLSVPLSTETTIFNVSGSGYCDYISLTVAPVGGCHVTELKVYCDNNLSLDENYSALSNFGYGSATPRISLTQYGANAQCTIVISIRFEFKQSLKITAY